MRVLIDVEDDDIMKISSARRNERASVVIKTPDGCVTGYVIGRAEPLSVVGERRRYTAFYSITFLDEL